jgi:hypothetical protein
MRLTPEYAERIGAMLRVPAKFLAFSNEPNVYGWAVKPVPVVGIIDSEMRIGPEQLRPRRIGVPDASVGLRALELGKDSMPSFEGWTILYDENNRERVSQHILDRQAQNATFVIRTSSGEMWWRRIVPSARRGSHHLESQHKQTIYDVEIDWVSEVLGFEPPGKDLPPFEQ